IPEYALLLPFERRRQLDNASAPTFHPVRRQTPGKPSSSLVTPLSRCPVQSRPKAWRRLVLPQLEHPAGRLDLGPDARPGDIGTGNVAVERSSIRIFFPWTHPKSANVFPRAATLARAYG